jgi:hypothetical protein
MPSIMVVAPTANGGEAAVFLAERLTTVQLDDAHFAAQLVERLKWAGEDAEHAEREAAIPTPGWTKRVPQLRRSRSGQTCGESRANLLALTN